MANQIPTKDQIRKGLQRFMEEQAPNEDGTCKNSNCNGRLVQQVRSFYQGQYYYTTARCGKCGREYMLGGKWASKTGHKSFRDMMRRPFTI